MSLRMKSLFAAFGVSIALWAVVIKGAMIVYPYAAGVNAPAPVWTAELDQSSGAETVVTR